MSELQKLMKCCHLAPEGSGYNVLHVAVPAIQRELDGIVTARQQCEEGGWMDDWAKAGMVDYETQMRNAIQAANRRFGGAA